MSDYQLFTSESVTEGHPDKLADAISDAILDACLTDDVYSRVAIETLLTRGLAVVAGRTDDADLCRDRRCRSQDDPRSRLRQHRPGLRRSIRPAF